MVAAVSGHACIAAVDAVTTLAAAELHADPDQAARAADPYLTQENP